MPDSPGYLSAPFFHRPLAIQHRAIAEDDGLYVLVRHELPGNAIASRSRPRTPLKLVVAREGELRDPAVAVMVLKCTALIARRPLAPVDLRGELSCTTQALVLQRVPRRS
jgi:hypothetical protein